MACFDLRQSTAGSGQTEGGAQLPGELGGHQRMRAREQHLEFGIPHLAQVLEDVKGLRPLIERHPEHRELADRVIAMYAGIVRRAWQNETSPNPGATTGTAGLQ